MLDIEIERRKTDRKDVTYMKAAIIKLEGSFASMESGLDTKLIGIHTRINHIQARVMGIFVSLGLLSIIILGSYYYINIVDARNDRGEEILLNKINSDYRSAKEERIDLVNQVVSLLTADAEQKQWQKGMMTQLELLNTHIRDIVELKHPGYSEEKDDRKN